jgi:HSP20 family protein
MTELGLTRQLMRDWPAFDLAPFSMFRKLGTEWERMFENRDFVPPLEIERKNGAFIVRAEIPGMNEKDIKVQFTEDGLVIEGERKQETKTEKDGYFRTERTYGKFYRCVGLPEGANPDKAAANYVNGVLEISVPLAEVKKPQVRQIPVKAS